VTLSYAEKEKPLETLSRTSDEISVPKSEVHRNEKERKIKSEREGRRERERKREEGGREERRGVPPRALGHPCW